MRFVTSICVLLLAACNSSPAPLNDAQFETAVNVSKGEEDTGRQQRITVAKRFNENARATNERLRSAYDRASEACNNLEKAGYQRSKGCPPPAPTYVELWDETGALRD